MKAEIIIIPIKHIKCICGEIFQIFDCDTTYKCSCRRVYDNNANLLGFHCWKCESNNTEKLYGEDRICKSCIKDLIKSWKQAHNSYIKGIETANKRLKELESVIL